MAQMAQMGADPLPAWARRRRLPAVPEVIPGCHGRAPQEARQRRPGMEPMLDALSALSQQSPCIPG